jgi:hypothetical protein
MYHNMRTLRIVYSKPRGTVSGQRGFIWTASCCIVGAVLSLFAATAYPQEELEAMPDQRIQQAIELMLGFAERTGLSGAQRPPRRYLWTDAFAVCNLLGLARETGEQRYTELALRLVEQAHHTLGRHRGDDSRSGWLSGEQGAAHPTRGGLRIGKPLPERAPGEPFDERLEWDRDGQYFHYLTKWMHALDRVSRSTGRAEYNQWARELAETSFAAFTYTVGAGQLRRMYWKMSIDLSHPLVASMGQHDPLDGYVTYLQLRSSAARLAGSTAQPSLDKEIEQFSEMIHQGEWATTDPLGIGGLLIDAYRVQQLAEQGAPVRQGLLEELLTASLAGLEYYARSGELQGPAEYRLAFRELGLAIGLEAVRRMRHASQAGARRIPVSNAVKARLQALMQYAPLRNEIESFWLDPAHRNASTWTEHRDINEVMLATSLAPEGFLVLGRPE